MTADALPEAPNGRRAEVWVGDAFELVGGIPDSSVDLILTSPPYWGLRTYGHKHNNEVLDTWRGLGLPSERTPPYDWYRGAGGILGLEPYPQWFVDHLVEFFNRTKAALTPTANVWVNLGDTYFARWSSIRDSGRQGFSEGRSRRRTPSGDYLHDKQLLMIPARFAIAMQDAGWILRNDLIWAKTDPLPRTAADRLSLSHEHWFHFVQRSVSGRPSYYYDAVETERGGRDVISAPSSNGTSGHSATFPPDLVRPRIASSCPPDGLVLDPFCGSGTTITEALSLGRRAIGMELSPKYAEVAQVALRGKLAELEDSDD